MKKIMFNDKYGLTEAVLSGRKTMTRRMVNTPRDMTYDFWNPIMGIDDNAKVYFIVDYCDGSRRYIYPQYQIDEELAVAQSYRDAGVHFIYPPDTQWGCTDQMAGYENKMFVRADLMPHRIRITDIKVERLQDISEEDCLREGIYKHNALPDALGEDRYKFISYAYDATQDKHRKRKWFPTPREAFAALIDKVVEFDHFRKSAGLKVCKRGTWDSNPWVWAYTFEVIK